MMEWEPKKCQFLIGNVRQPSADDETLKRLTKVSIPHR